MSLDRKKIEKKARGSSIGRHANESHQFASSRKQADIHGGQTPGQKAHPVSSQARVVHKNHKRVWVFLSVALVVLIVSAALLFRSFQVIVGKSQPTPVAQPLGLDTRYIGWLWGADCQNGKKAYLQRIQNEGGLQKAHDKDLFIVGNEWRDPTNGENIPSNNCGSPDMSDVVKLVHQNGGKVYVTLTIDGYWSANQTAGYIRTAAHDNGTLVRKIVRDIHDADGLINDIEIVADQTGIADDYTLFNQRLRTAVHEKSKFFGIALIHKTSDSERVINGKLFIGFQNWHDVETKIKPDIIVILAQDENLLQPGPLATASWLDKIVKYASQIFPSLLPDVIWTLFNYGRIWESDDTGISWKISGNVLMTYQQVSDLKKDRTLLIQVDDASNQETPSIAWVNAGTEIVYKAFFTTPTSMNFLLMHLEKSLQQMLRQRYKPIKVSLWWETIQSPPQLELVPALK